MAKVYMVRHQRAGIITSHAFAAPPTPTQQAAIVAECTRLHGPGGWAAIHEADLMSPSDLPIFPERAEGPAELPGPTVSATGTVSS